MAIDLYNAFLAREPYRPLLTPALPELPTYRSPFTPRADRLDPQGFERPWEDSDKDPPPVRGAAPLLAGDGESVTLFAAAAALDEVRWDWPYGAISAYEWTAKL